MSRFAATISMPSPKGPAAKRPCTAIGYLTSDPEIMPHENASSPLDLRYSAIAQKAGAASSALLPMRPCSAARARVESPVNRARYITSRIRAGVRTHLRLTLDAGMRFGTQKSRTRKKVTPKNHPVRNPLLRRPFIPA